MLAVRSLLSRGAGYGLVAWACLLLSGCGDGPISPAAHSVDSGSSSAPPAVAESTPAAPSGPVEPAQVEISDHKVRLDDQGIFWFGFKYKFVKGAPRMHYLVTVVFPGTNNRGLKTMESRELKMEGEIRDGVQLFERPVSEFEISFSEADSPMNEYKLISNVIKDKYSAPGEPAKTGGETKAPETKAPEAAKASTEEKK